MRTKFGVNQVMKHTPGWVVTSFSLAIVVLSVVSYMVSGDPGLSAELKARLLHYVVVVQMLLAGVAPFFGVDVNRVKGKV